MPAIGRYRGVDYKRQRICNIMVLSQRSFAYFTYQTDPDTGEYVPTGDMFDTLRELKTWIDSKQKQET